MKYIFENEEINEKDIQKLIDNGIEESIHLEYKQADALGKNDKKIKEISKDVASFANSDGGVLIYGIIEKDHKAHSLSFVNGSEYTKEWLEQIIQSNIHRNVPDLKILPVRFNSELNKTIYVITIPESYNAPHMSSDKKYYKRYNFQSVPMEEYEVRQIFNKIGLSKLEIIGCSLNLDNTFHYPDHETNTHYALFIFIQNVGNFIEKNYKTVIRLVNCDKSIKISTPRDANADAIKGIDVIKISCPSISPIFQGEILSGGQVNLTVPRNRCEELLNKIEVGVDLLYTNEVQSKSFFMKEIYAEYQGTQENN